MLSLVLLFLLSSARGFGCVPEILTLEDQHPVDQSPLNLTLLVDRLQARFGHVKLGTGYFGGNYPGYKKGLPIREWTDSANLEEPPVQTRIIYHTDAIHAAYDAVQDESLGWSEEQAAATAPPKAVVVLTQDLPVNFQRIINNTLPDGVPGPLQLIEEVKRRSLQPLFIIRVSHAHDLPSGARSICEERGLINSQNHPAARESARLECLKFVWSELFKRYGGAADLSNFIYAIHADDDATQKIATGVEQVIDPLCGVLAAQQPDISGLDQADTQLNSASITTGATMAAGAGILGVGSAGFIVWRRRRDKAAAEEALTDGALTDDVPASVVFSDEEEAREELYLDLFR